jgi:zinc protease
MIANGLAPVRSQLANGAVVIAKESRVTPAVVVHATVRAGIVFDPPGQGGMAHFVSRVIDRGTASRPADRIADELENRGVSLTVGVSRHAISLVCACLVEDLDAVLEIIADIIMRPTFPAPEVETRRGEIITFIRQDEDSPASVASEHLAALLYGPSHPFGRRPRGTIAEVERISRDDLVAFHRERFRPAGLSLVMVGDLDPQQAVDSASRVLGDWTSAPLTAARLPDPSPAIGRRVEVVPMMNKAQADIAYGFTTIRRADPRYYAYWLMNNILGQYALGGRLGDSIREQQGMAYYAFSAFEADVVSGSLIVRAGVNPENVERAVASIDAELARMAADGPTDRELSESKRYLIGSLPRNLETNLGIASFLQSAEFFGLGLDYDLRIPDLLNAVTREEVHAAARDVLAPSRAAVAVAGPYSGALG